MRVAICIVYMSMLSGSVLDLALPAQPKIWFSIYFVLAEDNE